jgi:hypothetical protein
MRSANLEDMSPGASHRWLELDCGEKESGLPTMVTGSSVVIPYVKCSSALVSQTRRIFLKPLQPRNKSV